MSNAPPIILLDKVKAAFMTGKTKSAEWRKQQLRQMLRGIKEMSIQMTAAIEKDLGKSPFVTELTSLQPCIWDIEYSLEHVEKVNSI